MKLETVGFAALTLVTVLSTISACSDTAVPTTSTGGSTLTGGTTGSGGATNSGGASGGATGGLSTGGQSTGGQSTGGQSTGGQSTGGQSTGGQNAGGQSTGGQSTGGNSASGGSSGNSATFAAVAALIKDRSTPHSCFGGSCHDSENPYFHLLGPDRMLLSDDALYTFMKGYMTRNCGPLINTANPAESAIVKLLKGPCGATPVMPMDKCYQDKGTIDGDCVPAESVNTIQQWIAAGAPR